MSDIIININGGNNQIFLNVSEAAPISNVDHLTERLLDTEPLEADSLPDADTLSIHIYMRRTRALPPVSSE